MLDQESQEIIMANCKAAKLRKRQIQKLVKWATMVSVNAGLLEAVLSGRAKIVGLDGQGEPLFSITDEGIDYVETELLPEARRIA